MKPLKLAHRDGHTGVCYDSSGRSVLCEIPSQIVRTPEKPSAFSDLIYSLIN